MRYLLPLLLFSALAPAQDMRVIKLEQDMRNLERQVQTLARQLDEVRLQLRGTGPRRDSGTDESRTSTVRDWLDARSWRTLKPGTGELDVIDALGPPTSMREENGERVLLYAMEIGSAGFLSGSVRLKDGVVIAVEVPSLK